MSDVLSENQINSLMSAAMKDKQNAQEQPQEPEDDTEYENAVDGDIYINPYFGDMWIVDSRYFIKINDGYKIELDDPSGFVKVGHVDGIINARNYEAPESVQRHRELCSDLNRLYAAKNADYGDSFHKRYVDWEERVYRLYDRNGGGLLSASIRIRDKADRFENLIASDNPNVKDESIRDTLIDLANYSLMTVMEIDKDAK